MLPLQQSLPSLLTTWIISEPSAPLLVLKPTGVASRPSQRVSNGWGQPLFHAPKNMNFADSAVECYKIPMLYKKRMKKGARTVEGGSTVEKFARS